MSEAFERAREGMARVGERRMQAYDGMMEQRTNRAAGNALQSGDYAGASNALYQGGNIQGGMAVQNAGRASQTADREQQQSAIVAAVTGLLHVPEAERGAMLQSRIAPLFQQLGMGDYIGQITPQDLTDQSLRGLMASMGGEVPQSATFNTRDGVVERDPFSGEYDMGYAVSAPEPPIPTGYRRTEAGALEIDPGYLAGQQALSGARRAPPRPRSSGGGGSAPRAAAPASRPPWERF